MVAVCVLLVGALLEVAVAMQPPSLRAIVISACTIVSFVLALIPNHPILEMQAQVSKCSCVCGIYLV